MKQIAIIILSTTLIISCGTSQLERYQEINNSPSISAYGEFAQNTSDESLKYKADREAYKLAEKENNEQSYKEYLKYFPKGSFAQFANNQLNELDLNKEYQSMLDAYKTAVTQNTLQSYVEFLKNYSGFDSYEAIDIYSKAYSAINYLSTKDDIAKLQKNLISKKWDVKLLESNIDFKPIWENEDKNQKDRLIDFVFFLYQNPNFTNISHYYDSKSRLLTIKIKLDIEIIEIVFRSDENTLIPRKYKARSYEKFDQDACSEVLMLYIKSKQHVYDSIYKKYNLKK